MRAADVRRAVDFLAGRRDVDAVRIDAVGRGTFAIPVLLEAVLDPDQARASTSLRSRTAILGHSPQGPARVAAARRVARFDVGDLLLALAP
jgi:hypothetical protein